MIICEGHSAPDSGTVYSCVSAWITVLIRFRTLRPLAGETHSFLKEGV
jgi:hypothetical protein